MKTTKSVAILLLLVFSVSLSSCAFFDLVRNSDTKDVIGKITDAMDNVSSFHMEGDGYFTVSAMQQVIEIDMTMEKIVLQGDGFSFFSTEDMTITVGGKQTQSGILEAFHDGKYFYEASQDSKVGGFYSEHTQEAFLAYYETVLSDNENFLDGYETLKHIENDDGTHKVILSNYSDETINTVNTLYGFPLESDGAVVRDCVVTIQTDNKYQITRVETEYVFSNTSCRGLQIVKCGNYDSAQMPSERLVVENYTKVEDARILALYTRLLNEKKNESTGTFTYADLRDVTSSDGKTEQIKQIYLVNYAQDENGYSFDIDIDIDNEKYKLTYAEGVCRLDDEIPEVSAITNDLEAKALIMSLIDFCEFHPSMVKEVVVVSEQDGHTTYEIVLDVKNRDVSSLTGNYLSTIGLSMSPNRTASLFVTIQDGVLYEVALDISAYYITQSAGQYINLRGGISIKTKFR